MIILYRIYRTECIKGIMFISSRFFIFFNRIFFYIYYIRLRFTYTFPRHLFLQFITITCIRRGFCIKSCYMLLPLFDNFYIIIFILISTWIYIILIFRIMFFFPLPSIIKRKIIFKRIIKCSRIKPWKIIKGIIFFSNLLI